MCRCLQNPPDPVCVTLKHVNVNKCVACAQHVYTASSPAKCCFQTSTVNGSLISALELCTGNLAADMLCQGALAIIHNSQPSCSLLLGSAALAVQLRPLAPATAICSHIYSATHTSTYWLVLFNTVTECTYKTMCKLLLHPQPTSFQKSNDLKEQT